MHIPDHLLKDAICPVTATMAIVGVAITSYFAYKSKEKAEILKFATTVALVFLLQMLNFPIYNGTSGHFVGIALLIFMLGIPYGILAMSIILTIQTLIFADGGISALGANILNMAIFGALPVIMLYKVKENKFIMFISSIFSVIFAAFSCAIFLAISHIEQAKNIISSMMSIHSLLAIFEGIITLIAFVSLNFIFEKFSTPPLKYLSIASIFIILLLITPFASSLPDGLEWVIEKYNLLKKNEPLFVPLIPDYSLKGINNEILSTILAGISGIIFTLITSIFMFIVLNIKNLNQFLKNEKGE